MKVLSPSKLPCVHAPHQRHVSNLSKCLPAQKLLSRCWFQPFGLMFVTVYPVRQNPWRTKLLPSIYQSSTSSRGISFKSGQLEDTVSMVLMQSWMGDLETLLLRKEAGFTVLVPKKCSELTVHYTHSFSSSVAIICTLQQCPLFPKGSFKLQDHSSRIWWGYSWTPVVTLTK